MSRFTLEIELENAAFHPEPEPEVGRILRRLADIYRRGRPLDAPKPVTDIHGNRVGTARIEEVSDDEG